MSAYDDFPVVYGISTILTARIFRSNRSRLFVIRPTENDFSACQIGGSRTLYVEILKNEETE